MGAKESKEISPVDWKRTSSVQIRRLICDIVLDRCGRSSLVDINMRSGSLGNEKDMNDGLQCLSLFDRS